MLDHLLGFAIFFFKINILMILSENKCDKQLKGPMNGMLEQEVAN